MNYRFGPFELDAATGSLNGPDGPIALRRQTFRLLEVLLARAPELVDRDTLLDEAWGRTALSPNVLPQAISELRQALGDSASDSRYIETKHRRGYRIIPEVERFESPAPSAPVREAAERDAAPKASGGRVGPAAVAAVAVAVALGAAWWWQGADERWLENELLPAVEAELENDVTAAWRLIRNARERVPNDPRLEQLWLDVSLPIPLNSDPEGALVEMAGYGTDSADWVRLGTTPLENVRLPLAPLRFRVSKPGYAPIVVAPGVLPFAVPFRLHTEDEVPEGMVYVPGGPVRYHGERRQVPAFWIDRFEVTNAEYLEFIEAGGYEDPDLWPERVEIDGQTIEREALLRRLIDGTGMRGPSTWALGTFPEGEADHPVEGVSWYEANAYAQWAGKQLPTAFHWYRAAGLGGVQPALFSEVLAASNFGEDGTRPVGETRGLGPFGTYDMAGNVREWSQTTAGVRRYAMGAAWYANSYEFADWQVYEPSSRQPGAGFRLIETERPIDEALLGDYVFLPPTVDEPVDDASFEIYARLYDYDDTPLNAEVVDVEDGHTDWRRERIEFDAAYGGERVILHLFVPKFVEPPFQTVVHFPGGDARLLDDSEQLGLLLVEPFLRTGRAVAYPVYQGTFERRTAPPSGPLGLRDQVIEQVKDVRRTLDYLETRKDIDAERMAWHAVSYGASRSPFVLAVERRFRTAMLVSTGLSPSAHLPPELHQVDYLSRISMPVLLLTGRNDLTMPYDEMQRPFFELLGTPESDKQHVALDTGHLPPGYVELSRHLMQWTDRWLGPVGDGRYSQIAPPSANP